MSGHPTVRRLLEVAGQTFSQQAGFTLRDRPAQLYQLSVLATTLAKPISADLAVAAARELRRAGCRTADSLLRTTWQQRVDALTVAHYRRFDESTATILEHAAEFLRETYRGDLRRLGAEPDGDPARAAELLHEIPGIGPAGADIFLREVQAVWTWVRPHADERVIDGARRLGFAAAPADVRRLVGQGDDAAARAAALVRATLGDDLVAQLTS